MSVETIYEYYRDIIPEPDSFCERVKQPLPTTLWVNTLKTNAATLQEIFQEQGLPLEKMTWNSEGFRCNTEQALGRSWQYLTGLCHIQEEVSMLPPYLLAPKPHDRVLDLCAAPGNKTAQLSVMMQNQGTVIANDCNYGRVRALGQMKKRLGLINISLTVYDGSNYPKLNNYFDKVLADVPCSCEGTFRKGSKKLITPNRQLSLSMSNIQKNLLRKALLLAKPGGRILYSTCTFAPEENERVIDQLIKEYPGLFRVIPIQVDNLQLTPGLTAWRDQQYDLSLKNTARIWPHLNNTGGFYLALLEKIEPSRQFVAVTPKRISQDNAKKTDDYLLELQQRFAISEDALSHYSFSHEYQRGIYMLNKNHQPPLGLNYDVSGLFFMKTNTRFPKITTAAAMILAKHANQNYVEIDALQLSDYLNKREIEISDQQASRCSNTGYVILKYQQQAVGVGLYLEPRDEQMHRVRSLFPSYLQGPM